MHVDARAGAGQATLGTGKLNPGDDLLLGAVAMELRVGGVFFGAARELVDPGLELGQGVLERVEAPALDARARPDGERPGGYERAPASAYLRWSIGT